MHPCYLSWTPIHDTKKWNCFVSFRQIKKSMSERCHELSCFFYCTVSPVSYTSLYMPLRNDKSGNGNCKGLMLLMLSALELTYEMCCFRLTLQVWYFDAYKFLRFLRATPPCDGRNVRFDLEYWGLDYPPLTAYVSWACGQLSRAVEPASMTLGLSRGFETPSHKVCTATCLPV